MNFRVLLFLVIGHLLSDFIFQNSSILKKRFSENKKEIIVGNLLHCLIHFSCSVILTLYFVIEGHLTLLVYLISLILIACGHFIIDVLKSLLILGWPSIQNNIYIFISDQLLHILTITLIVIVYNPSINLSKAFSFIKDYPNNIEIFDRWLILIIIFFACTSGVGIFIKKFITYINLKKYKKFIDKGNRIIEKNYDDLGIYNGGYIIGILERILILLGMAIGQPGIIGFVLTAKSIARFKKLDDSRFSEYFIVGTFISFICAIIGGIFISSLQVIPIII